jgi:signal recognition particle subunit SRP54
MIVDFIAKQFLKRIEKKVHKAKINQEDIENVLNELNISLFENEVDPKVITKLMDNIQSQLEKKSLNKEITLNELVNKICYEELVGILGHKDIPLNLNKKPTVILSLGLQGSGKTTSVVKLANFIKSEKKVSNILIVGCDVYRPAAFEQLHLLASKIGVEVFYKENSDPLTILKSAYYQHLVNPYEVIIIDTAGRLSIDEKMLIELKELNKF